MKNFKYILIAIARGFAGVSFGFLLISQEPGLLPSSSKKLLN